MFCVCWKLDRIQVPIKIITDTTFTAGVYYCCMSHRSDHNKLSECQSAEVTE